MSPAHFLSPAQPGAEALSQCEKQLPVGFSAKMDDDKIIRGFMRELANRLTKYSSQPDAAEYLVIIQAEINDLLAAHRVNLTPVPPKLLSLEEVAFFSQPRSAYEYLERFPKSYDSSRQYLAKALAVGDLFRAGTQEPSGPGRPAQLYCSNRKTALLAMYRQAKD